MSRDQLDQDFGGSEQSELPNQEMQTFVFSATLSKDLQLNLKRRKKGASRKAKAASTLGIVTAPTLFFRS